MIGKVLTRIIFIKFFISAILYARLIMGAHGINSRVEINPDNDIIYDDCFFGVFFKFFK